MKKSTEILCQLCGKPSGRTPSGKHRRKLCDDCLVKNFRNAGERTIEEAIYKTSDGQNKYRKIRHHARLIAKNSLMEKKCRVCEYDTHVELCHIKAINTFELSTKVKVVNDVSNLVFLCPNHHWEFDNGKITSLSCRDGERVSRLAHTQEIG